MRFDFRVSDTPAVDFHSALDGSKEMTCIGSTLFAYVKIGNENMSWS